MNCRTPNNITADFCDQHTNLRRFEPYKFQWNSTIQIANNSNHTMCEVGASHGRVIAGFWEQIAEKYGISARNFSLKFPNELTERFITDRIIGEGCTKVVIGIGQWTAGWPAGSPWLFPRYENEMHSAISTAQRLLRGKCDLFIRSVHYNALGDWKLTCPPKDWRSPPVIDGYNRILKRICDDLGVPLIDTNFIIGPMWDSSQDYSHYGNADADGHWENAAGEMDALFILQKMLEIE